MKLTSPRASLVLALASVAGIGLLDHLVLCPPSRGNAGEAYGWPEPRPGQPPPAPPRAEAPSDQDVPPTTPRRGGSAQPGPRVEGPWLVSPAVAWTFGAAALAAAALMYLRTVRPMARLRRRVQALAEGSATTGEISKDMRGQAFALARNLESALDKLAHLSRTDELTGLANRRHFEEVFSLFFQQARRYHRPMSVMVMDLDFFKAVNDTGGHSVGDDLLKAVSGCVVSACRRADLPARLGGDEFAVLLPETSAVDAAAVAERIRDTVAQRTMVVKGVEIHVTVSLGIADLSPETAQTPKDLIALADEALYQAKQQGRDRVVRADGNGPGRRRSVDPRVPSIHTKLAGLDNQFQNVFLDAVREIVKMLERRDPHMADHARKVQRGSVLIAWEMELPDRMVRRLEVAAMLHDIGMLVLPDEVLLCPGDLTDEQLELIRRHPLLGVQIMEAMQFLESEIPAVRHHHEWYNGSGYPQGLAGPAIPLMARILAVADGFVAITSPRSFRSARSIDQALAELHAAAGGQFDPGVVDALAAAVARHGQAAVDLSKEIYPPAHLQRGSAQHYQPARSETRPRAGVPTTQL